MNKTLLVFKQELITTLKRPGFIIMTLILPVAALLVIGIAFIVGEIKKPAPIEVTNIGCIDNAGGFDHFTAQGQVSIVAFTTPQEATQAMVKGDIKEYFVVSSDYSSSGLVNLYTLLKEPAPAPEIMAAIKNFMTSNLLSGKISPASISVIESPLNLVSTRITASGEVASEQGGYGNLLIPGIFSMLLVLSLSFSSAYLLQGLGEEKESRLIEVLLSSVSTRQLLVGKVLGLGVAGLVQVVVWLISLSLLLNLATSVFGGFFIDIQIPANFLVLGIVYFILGYSIFAVLSAGIGAITPSAREGQQLASIFTLLAVSPLWFSSVIILYPNSAIWVALTIFPLTAPVTLMLRLGLTEVPAWQIATSIAVLIVCILGLLAASVKILRTYLLMYGKRPSFSELLRNLRSK